MFCNEKQMIESPKKLDYRLRHIIFLIMKSWKQLNDEDMKYISLKSHKQTLSSMEMTRSHLTQKGMYFFSTGRWHRLIKIHISSDVFDYQNKIGNLGCKYLAKVPLPSIRNIALMGNQIEAPGVWHLSKAKWNTLLSIELEENNLSVGSLEKLVRANWRRIQAISISHNQITVEELKQMLKDENNIHALHCRGLITFVRNRFRKYFDDKFYLII